MGFNLASTLFKNLHLNVLFTSEYKEPPYFDYSLSGLVGYKLPNKMFDFGAGICFNRLIPISPEKNNNKRILKYCKRPKWSCNGER